MIFSVLYAVKSKKTIQPLPQETGDKPEASQQDVSQTIEQATQQAVESNRWELEIIKASSTLDAKIKADSQKSIEENKKTIEVIKASSTLDAKIKTEAQKMMEEWIKANQQK